MSSVEPVISFTILGQPCSKANSRQNVRIRGKTIFIKSKTALQYVQDFHKQCPRLEPMLIGDVGLHMTIYYASRRSDLDESLILDCMQGFIYLNDRQVKERHVFWGLDKENPRTEIKAWSLPASSP